MIITLTALLAAAQALPQIDRTALELQSRAEALQPRARTTAPGPRKPTAEPVAQPSRTVAARPQTVRPGPSRSTQTQSANAGSAAQRRNQPRRATSGGPLDLASITTICRAAGNQEDPAAFIGRISTAYALSAADSTSLRASCAAYLAGRADARRSSGGTY
ncbi:MAG TPA: hypothetical protein VMG08_02005 [Allosphingosinicella sp.]|nr:hypothetical protein [Allosphingosinicella sp.]